MSITKPYYRIYRPGASNTNYISDSRNINNIGELYRAFKLLEFDLKKIFEFIEPNDNNLKTYSHRLYEILLRAATEFETNAKEILTANGYTRSGNLEMQDYRKLNKPCKMSEYEVILDTWSPLPKRIKPFEEWRHSHTINWYQAYNNVKHNRSTMFNEASLENVITAISGVLVILYAQIDHIAETGLYREGRTMLLSVENNGCTNPMFVDTIFNIKRPSSWREYEKYSFDWETLKTEPEPFQKYNFT